MAALREPQCELFVETVEPADVGEDDDADAVGFLRNGDESGEAVPVCGFEHKVVV